VSLGGRLFQRSPKAGHPLAYDGFETPLSEDPIGVGSIAFLTGKTLWVPNWSSTLCDLGMFVDQSPEPIATSDAGA
jgi:hypothetical protein